MVAGPARTDDHRGYAVVRPEAHLDHFTTPGFRQALREAAGAGPVIVDLTDVDFADSEGIGALAGAVRRSLESGGTVVVACRRPSLLRVLNMSRIDAAVAVVPTVEEAALLLRAGRADEEDGHALH